MTEEEIKSIQRGKPGLPGIDWFGKPLLIDGDYGQRTQWWHWVTTFSDFRQRVLRRMLGYHAGGLKETTGANRDPIIDKMQEPAGLTPTYGHPWCVMFVSHCLREEGGDWPIYHAHTGEMLKWAAYENRITLRPKPGDIAAFLYEPAPHRTPGSGHSEFVLCPFPNFTMDCGGNLGNMVRVGYRARPGLSFINIEPSAPQAPTSLPRGLLRLDGVADR